MLSFYKWSTVLYFILFSYIVILNLVEIYSKYWPTSIQNHINVVFVWKCLIFFIVMIRPSCRSLSTMWRFLTTTSRSCTAWWAPGPSHPTQLSGPASSHGSIPSTPTLLTPMFQVFFHKIPCDSVSAMTCRNCFFFFFLMFALKWEYISTYF